MLEHRIKITGIGVMTPIAQTPDEFWRKLVEGAERVHLSGTTARPALSAETFRTYCERAIRACIQDAGLDCNKKDASWWGRGWESQIQQCWTRIRRQLFIQYRGSSKAGGAV
ncbi:MAG: beta-ketoacyl synthase N-terminal-like domain-containing protein [Clostridia bacterium]